MSGRPVAKVWLVSCVLLIVGACGVSTGSTGSTEPGAATGSAASGDSPDNPAELAEFLGSTMMYDFEPYASPEALRSASDIAVLGRVNQVSSGTIDTPAEDTGVAVVALTVDDVWKADGEKAPTVVRYLVHRPTNVAIDLYQQALPEGTRVALFGFRTTYTFASGDPGGIVYDPAGQGLIFETAPNSTVNVWGTDIGSSEWDDVDTIEELHAALDTP